ncbi:hypothetical protein J2T12_001533 [Paenibacillus anaericanus]|nr:hypothetical protein [Paenibacillus anaericanus]MDQ0088127.1 hypothetical protein [Paenibacillus anaericanus]
MRASASLFTIFFTITATAGAAAPLARVRRRKPLGREPERSGVNSYMHLD